MCYSVRKARNSGGIGAAGRMWLVGTHPRKKTRDFRRICKGWLKDGHREVSCEFFLNLSVFSAMWMFAETLNVQPALSLSIGPSKAAAVC